MPRKRPARFRLNDGFLRQCIPALGLVEMPDPDDQPPGRYNRRGEPTWYASSTTDAAWAEYYKRWGDPVVDPREVLRRSGLTVVQVDVLDLTDAEAREAVGITEHELRSDDTADVAHCQDVADWARRNGYQGILAPLAALDAGETLAVFDGTVLFRAEVREDDVTQPPPDPRS